LASLNLLFFCLWRKEVVKHIKVNCRSCGSRKVKVFVCAQTEYRLYWRKLCRRVVTFSLVSFSYVSWLRKYNTMKRGTYFVNTLHLCNALIPRSTPPAIWAPAGVVFLQGLHNVTWIYHAWSFNDTGKESENAWTDDICGFQTEQVDLGLKLHTCSGRRSSYPLWGFLWFLSVHPVKWRDISSIRLRHLLQNPFQFLPQKLYSLDAESIVKQPTKI
jgi:hypothetical protein